MPQPTVNSTRLNHSLEQLGLIGDTSQGMQRLAFTPADITGREYAISLMRRAVILAGVKALGVVVPQLNCSARPS